MSIKQPQADAVPADRVRYVQDTFLGYDSRNSPILIPPGRGRYAQNVEFTPLGLFKKGMGSKRVFEQRPAPANIIRAFRMGTNPDKYICLLANNTIATMAAPEGWVTIATGISFAPMSRATLNNKVYLANGTDPLIEYDPATNTTTLLTDAPLGNIVVQFESRIWIAGVKSSPSAVYPSALGDGSTYDLLDSFELSSVDKFTDSITSMRPWNARMVVFKTNHVYEFSTRAGTFLDVDPRGMYSGVGPRSHEMTAVGGEGVYFIMPKEGIYKYTGETAPTLISERVKGDFLYDFDFNSASHRPVLECGSRQLYFAGWVPNEQRWRVLLCDLDEYTHVVGSGAEWLFSGQGGDVYYTRRDKPYLYLFDDNRTTFDGESIESFMEVPDSALGLPINRKRFREIMVETDNPQATWKLEWWVDGGDPTATSDRMRHGIFSHQPETNNAARWDMGNWDGFNWASDADAIDQRLFHFPQGARGRNIRWKFSATGAEPITLRRLTLNYIPIKGKR